MKNWDDQPDEVAEWPVLTSFWTKGTLRNVIIEVRLGPNQREKTFYVSHGNLFGSQTLHCENGDAAFILIGQIVDSTRNLADDVHLDVPAGCTLLKSAEKK